MLTLCHLFWHLRSTDVLAQTVKRLSTMRETWVQSLGWEDPLEKEMAIHSSSIAWKIPWTEEPDRLQSMGSQRVRHDWATSLSFTFKVYWNVKTCSFIQHALRRKGSMLFVNITNQMTKMWVKLIHKQVSDQLHMALLQYQCYFLLSSIIPRQLWCSQKSTRR